MEELLAKEFGSSSIKKIGLTAGGCISQGQGYSIDGKRFFVKHNDKPGAKKMFTGEFESLNTLQRAHCVIVPAPLKIIDLPSGGSSIVTEYIEMHRLKSASARLGEHLAKLHLQNQSLRSLGDGGGINISTGQTMLPVDQFGFHTVTCCGFIPQENTWTDDWITFFSKFRLEAQVNLTQEKNSGDHDIIDIWLRLRPKVPHFFRGIEIFPSLLHGDLWSGNVAQNEKAEPIIFDPASFYGHSEYDLSISTMFGGFDDSFYGAYHRIIPKTDNFAVRQKLYQLFHYLNHYNLFGSGYTKADDHRHQTLLEMKSELTFL